MYISHPRKLSTFSNEAYRREGSQNSSLNIGLLLLCLNVNLTMDSLILLVSLWQDHSYNLVLSQIQIYSLNQSPTSVSIVDIKSLFPFLASCSIHELNFF